VSQRTFTDTMSRQVTINYPPQRIISVVPSQTELLFDLGLNEEVVGITKFCIHPNEWFRTKERVGGTKQLNIDKIKALNPELIIANKEENLREQIEELASQFPVWISDIANLDDALRMIQEVGLLVDKEEKANSLAKDIAVGFTVFNIASTPKRVAYFIWYNPWMSIGGDTFISNMIKTIGWQNVLEDQTRYPEITLEQLKEYQPEVVLLSSEPFPFKEKHIAEVKAVLPNTEVVLVDGEMFSWYGSRLIKAIPYLETLVKNIS
jgi:ABC-type Fe3+-hydroxamate transport system substrate-binding protein